MHFAYHPGACWLPWCHIGFVKLKPGCLQGLHGWTEPDLGNASNSRIPGPTCQSKFRYTRHTLVKSCKYKLHPACTSCFSCFFPWHLLMATFLIFPLAPAFGCCSFLCSLYLQGTSYPCQMCTGLNRSPFQAKRATSLKGPAVQTPRLCLSLGIKHPGIKQS